MLPINGTTSVVEEAGRYAQQESAAKYEYRCKIKGPFLLASQMPLPIKIDLKDENFDAIFGELFAEHGHYTKWADKNDDGDAERGLTAFFPVRKN